MPISKGSSPATAIYFGDLQVSRVMYGTVQVFPESGYTIEPHRFWKLANIVTSDPYVVFAEAYLREDVGVNEMPIAYASSTPIGPSGVPSWLTDGLLTTYYHGQSGGNGTDWVAFEYTDAILPIQLVISAASNNVVPRTPTQLVLMYSDDGLTGPWFPHASVVFGDGWGSGETRIGSIVPIQYTEEGHRFWRIGDMSSAEGNYVVFGGAYLRQVINGQNEIPLAHFPYGNSGDHVGRLYDGNINSYWHSAPGASGTASVAFDYGGPILPAQVVIQATSTNVVSRTPISGIIYYSDVGIEGPWTPYDSFDVGLGWSGGETRTATIEPALFDMPRYTYTGAVQTYTVAEAGLFSFKLWGGAGVGGWYNNDRYGGAGGFASGKIEAEVGDVFELYVGQGGFNGPSRAGGWPDGGTGSAGDTQGGGGGGSTSLWKNGELIAVAGGGGSAAGYGGTGGGGGGLAGGQNGNGSGGTQTGSASWGSADTKKGLSMLALAAASSWPGRTGGNGGTGGGDDGGAGGGGYWGGGGGGGDGNAGGGGSGYLSPDVIDGVLEAGENGRFDRPSRPGGFTDPYYATDGTGLGGRTSNSGTKGGNGLILFKPVEA